MYYSCYWRVEGTPLISESMYKVNYKYGDTWRPQYMVNAKIDSRKNYSIAYSAPVHDDWWQKYDINTVPS